MLKKILAAAVAFVLFPSVAGAAITAGWSATSTSQGWIFPTRINGTEQTVVSQNFIATSTSLSSRFPYASSTALTVSGNSYLGTVSSGTWNGTAITGGFGGTGQSSYSVGDTLYASGATTLSKLTIGNSGDVLTVNGGVPVWLPPSGGTGTWATTSEAYYWSQFRDFKIDAAGSLTSTTSLPFLINNASSTITNLFSIFSTSTNATSTNLFATTASTTNLFVGGKIGVHTIAPQSPVEIVSTTASSDSAGGLVISRTGTASQYVFMNENAGSTHWVGGRGSKPFDFTNEDNTAGGLGFEFDVAGATAPAGGTRALVIANTGFVGIGTTTPPSKLTIQGSDTSNTTNALTVYSSAANTPIFAMGDGGTLGVGNIDFGGGNAGRTAQRLGTISNDQSSGITFNASQASAPLIFQTGSAERMRIDSTGNVGIGTSSPYTRLAVAGTTTAEAFVATSTISTSTFAGPLSVDLGSNTLPGNSWFRVGSSTSNILVDKVSGNVGIGTSSPYAFLSVYNSTLATSFAVGSTSSTTFAVTNKGRVGIGTSDPQGTLHIFNNSTAGGWPSIILGGNNGGDTDFNISRFNTNDGVNNDSLRFGTSTVSGTNTFLTMDYTGFIGFGTTSPYTQVAVVGTTTTSSLNATSTIFGAGLTSCNSASNALTWVAGAFGCNTIASGGSNTDKLATSSSQTRTIYPNGGNDVAFVIGGGATSTNTLLQVYGTTTSANLVATSTAIASTTLSTGTAITGNGICPLAVNGVCYPYYSTTTLSTAIGTTTLAGIPNFSDIHAWFNSTTSSAGYTGNIYFNSDFNSSTIYDYQYLNYTSGGVATAGNAVNQKAIIGVCPQALSPMSMSMKIDINNQQGTAKTGRIDYICGDRNATFYGGYVQFIYRNNASITSINVTTNSTVTFGIGTHLEVTSP